VCRAYFNAPYSDVGQAAGVRLSEYEIRDGSGVRSMVNLRDKVDRLLK
jgi:hypothetical protein